MEKYSIVYSYNTVLGEEPPLKNVNLICIAVKKKKNQVVFESVVNYLKSLLAKNDNLRLTAGINAFKSIFGENPNDEQLNLLKQTVFEGPVYSYSELKVLLDLNKERFFELKKKEKPTEKELEIAKKDEISKPKIEKVIKALASGPRGEILNCLLIQHCFR